MQFEMREREWCVCMCVCIETSIGCAPWLTLPLSSPPDLLDQQRSQDEEKRNKMRALIVKTKKELQEAKKQVGGEDG